MVIVLIHWRIKPTEEAIKRFLDFWQTKATIKNKTGLIGEFLSKPLGVDKVPFKVDDLSPKADDAPYVSFVNVGLWKDMEAFYQQVGQYFNDDNPLLDFEQYRRTRTILNPESWRIGNYNTPEQSSFHEE